MILTRPKIKKVKIKDYGIIKNAEINLKEGLNVIIGKNCTGKSTVINAIKYALGREDSSYEKGNISIELYSNKLSCQLSKKKEVPGGKFENSSQVEKILLKYKNLKLDGNECILIDDEFSSLNMYFFRKLLEFFKKNNSQVISTFLYPAKFPPLEINMIDTKDFKLK